MLFHKLMIIRSLYTAAAAERKLLKIKDLRNAMIQTNRPKKRHKKNPPKGGVFDHIWLYYLTIFGFIPRTFQQELRHLCLHYRELHRQLHRQPHHR